MGKIWDPIEYVFNVKLFCRIIIHLGLGVLVASLAFIDCGISLSVLSVLFFLW